MTAEMERESAARFALGMAVRNSGTDWCALVVPEETRPGDAAIEIARQLELLRDEPVRRIEAPTADALIKDLANSSARYVVASVGPWDVQQWQTLDIHRARLKTGFTLALVMTAPQFESLQQAAPNLSSFLGAAVSELVADESTLSLEAREIRLKALRKQYNRSDEDVLAAATDHTLPSDPDFAEWLVLLGRGDLL